MVVAVEMAVVAEAVAVVDSADEAEVALEAAGQHVVDAVDILVRDPLNVFVVGAKLTAVRGGFGQRGPDDTAGRPHRHEHMSMKREAYLTLKGSDRLGTGLWKLPVEFVKAKELYDPRKLVDDLAKLQVNVRDRVDVSEQVAEVRVEPNGEVEMAVEETSVAVSLEEGTDLRDTVDGDDVDVEDAEEIKAALQELYDDDEQEVVDSDELPEDNDEEDEPESEDDESEQGDVVDKEVKDVAAEANGHGGPAGGKARSDKNLDAGSDVDSDIGSEVDSEVDSDDDSDDDSEGDINDLKFLTKTDLGMGTSFGGMSDEDQYVAKYQSDDETGSNSSAESDDDDTFADNLYYEDLGPESDDSEQDYYTGRRDWFNDGFDMDDFMDGSDSDAELQNIIDQLTAETAPRPGSSKVAGPGKNGGLSKRAQRKRDLVLESLGVELEAELAVPRRKSKNKTPDFKGCDDPELREQLLRSWNNSKEAKRQKRRERQEMRREGLLFKSGTPSEHELNLFAKYPDSITVNQVVDEIGEFVASTYESIRFTPMDPNARFIVKELLRAYNVSVTSGGDGRHKHIIGVKVGNRHKARANFQTVTKYLNRRKVFPRTDRTPQRLAGKLPGTGLTRLPKRKGGPKHLREGEVVGADAEELGAENIGRQMLEKLGWLPGVGLGTTNVGMLQPVEARVKKTKWGLGS